VLKGAHSGVIRPRVSSATNIFKAREEVHPSSPRLLSGASNFSLAGWHKAVNQNVEPIPSVLFTPISPPIISASCFEMASPSPVPPYVLDVELLACWKAAKSLIF